MIVKDLIENLQKFSPDVDVCIIDEEGLLYLDINDINVDPYENIVVIYPEY